MVEFKRPCHGGSPVLMEINARPWGSISLPITCGIDYPRLWVDWLLTGKLPPEKIEYKKGITCRRLVSELTHLAHTFHGTPPGWPVPYPGFLQTLLKISVPWYPGATPMFGSAILLPGSPVWHAGSVVTCNDPSQNQHQGIRTSCRTREKVSATLGQL